MNLFNWNRRPETKRDPILTMEYLQKEINDFLSGVKLPVMGRGVYSPKEWEDKIYPPIDILENKDSYKVIIELPGIDESDVDCTLKDNILSIRGEKKIGNSHDEKNKWMSRERIFGPFIRNIPFAHLINEENVKATVSRGILSVEVEKLPQDELHTRKIDITLE